VRAPDCAANLGSGRAGRVAGLPEALYRALTMLFPSSQTSLDISQRITPCMPSFLRKLILATELPFGNVRIIFGVACKQRRGKQDKCGQYK
jgi:hypothetical protein